MDINPVEYFKEYDFAESLVERIIYQAEPGQLDIVLTYMGFIPAIARPLDDPAFQQPVDFRRLLFEDVTQLERTNYRYKSGFRGFDPANFNLSETKPNQFGHTTIEYASVRKIMDARRTIVRHKAEIHMGSLGTYGFEFGGLSADQRLVKIVPLPGGEFSQIDYYTGERIDFYNPFSVR